MKRIGLLTAAVVAAIGLYAATAQTSTTAQTFPAAQTSQPPATQTSGDAAACLATGRLPAGYRDWRLISVAREEGNIDDIRAILGNDAAIDALRERAARFPDGAVIARLAWSLDASEENNRAFGRAQSFVAGHPKNGVQFMVRDSARYAATGGWGFSQFDDGRALADAATLRACYECHAQVEARDLVFTRYAP